MRVLSLTTIYPNEQFSAEGRSVAMLDAHLAKLGVEGTTLVLKPWIPNALARRRASWQHTATRARVEQREGYRVIFSHYLHVPMRFSLELCVRFMALQAKRLVRRYGVEFEIVHGQSIYPPAVAAQRVADEFGVPFVITLRDDLSHLRDLYELRQARGLFAPMFEKVGAIFAHGPAIVREMPEYLPPNAHPPVLLAANGVDVAGLGAMIAGFGEPPPRPECVVVSVSSLFRYKGIHENLEALRQLDAKGLRAWRYVVVGEGPYRTELEELARQYGLADRVEFRGRLAHGEAIRAIWDADFFCLPSWGEPFGNVYAEAALCGRAAIGCRGYGAEITIRDKETGLLVVPRDAEDLARALEILMTQPDARRAMGERAREHIKQFTWDKTAELYRAQLERVAARTRTGMEFKN